MASEIKRLITRALDSLAVDGLLHAAGQDEPCRYEWYCSR